MNVVELLKSLQASGLKLEPTDGGNIHITPAEKLTPEKKEAIIQNKSELLEILTAKLGAYLLTFADGKHATVTNCYSESEAKISGENRGWEIVLVERMGRLH